MAKKGKNQHFNRNPTGKGGFKDHPETRNNDGAPRKGESIAEAIRYFLDGEADVDITDPEGTPIGTEKQRRIAMLIREAFIEAVEGHKGWAFRFLASYGYGFPAQSTEQQAAGMNELLESLEAADRMEEDSEAIRYLKEAMNLADNNGNGNGSGGNGDGTGK